jgi:putative transposase
MVEKGHPHPSVVAQCRLLSIPRSMFYHRPAGETAGNLALMRMIDRQFMETPFSGVQQMTWHLRNEGHALNPKRVRRLMRLMGPMPIYRKPNTGRPAKGRRPFPYLLRGLTIDRPNQVWCADIAYIHMRRGVRDLSRTGGVRCLTLPRGGHGLAQPPGAGVAAVEHAGG